jgi:hypothetical protein
MARLALVTIVFAVTVIGMPVRRAEGAVLVCQNKKKAKQVALRADRCTKKENVALDLTGTVAAQGQMLTDQGQTLAGTESGIGLVCPGDPARKLVLSHFATPPNLNLEPRRGLIRERPGGGCRSLDGNQTACVASFQNNDSFFDNEEVTVSACFYAKGLCLPCTLRAANRGGCANACFPPRPTCAADPSRTRFVGGPNADACTFLATQGDCEKAWHVAFSDTTHASSCYWTGTACKGCGPFHENKGDCTNTCGATPHPCKDGARVTFAGGPGRNPCSTYDGNQAGCEQAYHRGSDGLATCWYDTAAAKCHGCGQRWELAGKCTNSCI